MKYRKDGGRPSTYRVPNIWVKINVNTRDEFIPDVILNLNIAVVNRVSDPNFVVPNRKEAIGITVISLSHCFFSDHRYLEFLLRKEANTWKTHSKQKEVRHETDKHSS